MLNFVLHFPILHFQSTQIDTALLNNRAMWNGKKSIPVAFPLFFTEFVVDLQGCVLLLLIWFCKTIYCIGLSRYIAITNLSIIAVFVEYLRQFLIDLNQFFFTRFTSATNITQKMTMLMA